MENNKDFSCLSLMERQKGKDEKEKQQIDMIPNEIVDLNFLKDNFNLKYYAYSESLEHVLNIDFF
jgi:hypothetical protein